MAPTSSVCPQCGLPACATHDPNAPAVERRQGQVDRRQNDRRFFPRPEGRRRSGGRRRTDPAS